MKQRITSEQLQELNEEQKQRLRDLWKSGLGDSFATFIASGWRLPKYDGPPIFYESRIREKIVGACGGYCDCESVIDDGDDPAVMPDETSLPLLSIGQMIEILTTVTKNEKYNDLWHLLNGCSKCRIAGIELCDALWQAVKAVL